MYTRPWIGTYVMKCFYLLLGLTSAPPPPTHRATAGPRDGFFRPPPCPLSPSTPPEAMCVRSCACRLPLLLRAGARFGGDWDSQHPAMTHMLRLNYSYIESHIRVSAERKVCVGETGEQRTPSTEVRASEYTDSFVKAQAASSSSSRTR